MCRANMYLRGGVGGEVPERRHHHPCVGGAGRTIAGLALLTSRHNVLLVALQTATHLLGHIVRHAA